MRSKLGIGSRVGLGLLVTAAFSTPSWAVFSTNYGGTSTNHVLLPWFIVDLNDTSLTHQTTLTIITNLDTDAPGSFPVSGTPVGAFIRVRLFNENSVEACHSCQAVTAEGDLVGNIENDVKNVCDGAGRDLLDFHDGTFRGYATFELSSDAACTTERVNSHGLVGYFYQVQLNRGLASGIDGPGYSGLGPDGLSNFLLFSGERLYFRFLVSLSGIQANASTRAVIWGATSGNCVESGLPVPDAKCLSGIGAGGTLRVCDESESCTSVALPSLTKEVNFISVDSLLPGSFATGGGYFILQNDPTKSNNRALSVLGYADNMANSSNASLNWRAIFPAQRDVF